MKLEIDDICYHVELCGTGFPFLLLHGFTGDTSTWTSFCDEWGQHSRLIIPDIVGHGKTDSPIEINRYKMEHAASDINKILDKLDIEKVDLLGYSMGGRLALTFAILYPERVQNLILESASPGLITEKERESRRMKDAELADFIMERGVETFVNHWERIPLFATMEKLPEYIRLEVRKQRLSNNPLGLAHSLRGMGTGSQPSWWDQLEQVSCKVLLLTGDADEKFCEIAEKMKNSLKNSTWQIIKNSGHAIHVEKKEKFGTIVSGFLKNN